MAADRTGRWEDVRRALGRLIGRVASHSLPEAQAGIAVVVRHSAATLFSEPEPGVRQGEWRSSAQVWDLPALTAPAGGGGIDASSVVTVIGANGALESDKAVVTEAACRFAEVPVHAWTPERDLPGVPPIQQAPVRFDEAVARQAGMISAAPVVRPVTVMRSVLPRPKPENPAVWPIKPGQVRTGLAPILRVPILCPMKTEPGGIGAFAAERRLLAAAAKTPEADVTLIGVFPHVPLGAVQRLSVAPGGAALQVWVRPDGAGRGTATVTVVLGRQRSTGKILQAVSRGVGTNLNDRA